MDDMNSFLYGSDSVKAPDNDRKTLTRKEKSKTVFIIIAVIFLALFVSAVFGDGNGLNYGFAIKIEPEIFTPVFLILCLFFIAMGLITIVVFFGIIIKKIVNKKDLDEKRSLDPIKYDFDNGKRFFDDNLIVGRKYIFGRGNERIFSVDELTALGLIYDSNLNGDVLSFPSGRMYLAAVLSNGETERICTVNSTGDTDEDKYRWNSLVFCLAGKMLKKECNAICIDDTIYKTEEELKYTSDRYYDTLKKQFERSRRG